MPALEGYSSPRELHAVQALQSAGYPVTPENVSRVLEATATAAPGTNPFRTGFVGGGEARDSFSLSDLGLDDDTPAPTPSQSSNPSNASASAIVPGFARQNSLPSVGGRAGVNTNVTTGTAASLDQLLGESGNAQASTVSADATSNNEDDGLLPFRAPRPKPNFDSRPVLRTGGQTSLLEAEAPRLPAPSQNDLTAILEDQTHTRPNRAAQIPRQNDPFPGLEDSRPPRIAATAPTEPAAAATPESNRNIPNAPDPSTTETPEQRRTNLDLVTQSNRASEFASQIINTANGPTDVFQFDLSGQQVFVDQQGIIYDVNGQAISTMSQAEFNAVMSQSPPFARFINGVKRLGR